MDDSDFVGGMLMEKLVAVAPLCSVFWGGGLWGMHRKLSSAVDSLCFLGGYFVRDTWETMYNSSAEGFSSPFGTQGGKCPNYTAITA